MAVKNGTDILLKLAASLVDGTISQEINFDRDMIDVTTKDSTGKDKEYIAGEKGATMGVEGKWAESTSNYSVQDMFDAWDSGNAVAFIYGGPTTGDLVFTGSAFVKSFSPKAPKNAEATWSASLQVTGVTVRGTAS